MDRIEEHRRFGVAAERRIEYRVVARGQLPKGTWLARTCGAGLERCPFVIRGAGHIVRIREPIVAGQFYAAERTRCASDLKRLLAAEPAGDELSTIGEVYGGLIPHAGWMFSGSVAAAVFKVLSERRSPQVVVIVGGVHRHRGRQAALFPDGQWQTPLGPVAVDYRLAERVLAQTNLIIEDPFAHESEHSIEVQVPFIAHLFPGAPILPIMVPPMPSAHEVGEAVARTITAYGYDALVLGTTDLTHYGPRYDFTPRGLGSPALEWAKLENDRRFIDLLCDMRAGELVAEACAHRNACSSGAAAATVAACARLGAATGVLLRHTTSREVLSAEHRGSSSPVDDSVGYAGIVFT